VPEKKEIQDAFAIIKEDHRAVKELFDQFEAAETAAEKRKIIDQAVGELKIHATIEEEIFYPAVRAEVGGKIMNEADTEHHVARILIAELDEAGNGDDHREARFTVLAESVRHHIKEEEGQMLPSARRADLDFDELGSRMLERKQELKEGGVPEDAEHAMVASAQARPSQRTVAASRGKKNGASARSQQKSLHSR
jgi:hypothetical protein